MSLRVWWHGQCSKRLVNSQNRNIVCSGFLRARYSERKIFDLEWMASELMRSWSVFCCGGEACWESLRELERCVEGEWAEGVGCGVWRSVGVKLTLLVDFSVSFIGVIELVS